MPACTHVLGSLVLHTTPYNRPGILSFIPPPRPPHTLMLSGTPHRESTQSMY